MRKKGFTLAEVLITLSIIGVVGALTIPSIMRSYEKTVFRNAFKKHFSDITQAAKLVINDNGGTINGLGVGASYPAYTALTAYSNYFTFVKRCGDSPNPFPARDCISDYYKMNGDAVSATAGNWWSSAILKNGATIKLGLRDAAGTEDIVVDVNGSKGPNVIGRDIFSIVVVDNKVVPYGVSPYNEPDYACDSSHSGWNCAVKVIKNEDY